MFKKKKEKEFLVSDLYLAKVCVVHNYMRDLEKNEINYKLKFVKFSIVCYHNSGYYINVINNEKYDSYIVDNGYLQIDKDSVIPLSNFINSNEISETELIELINKINKDYNEIKKIDIDDINVLLKELLSVLNEEQRNKIKEIVENHDNIVANYLKEFIEKEEFEDINILKRERGRNEENI